MYNSGNNLSRLLLTFNDATKKFRGLKVYQYWLLDRLYPVDLFCL